MSLSTLPVSSQRCGVLLIEVVVARRRRSSGKLVSLRCVGGSSQAHLLALKLSGVVDDSPQLFFGFGVLDPGENLIEVLGAAGLRLLDFLGAGLRCRWR